MKEKEFENKIKAYLKSKDMWVLKTWSNGIQRQGVPDLVCCINGFFVGIEIKAEKGKPSKLQEWNIEKIREAGGIGIILYPKQFQDFEKLVSGLMDVDPLLQGLSEPFDERKGKK